MVMQKELNVWSIEPDREQPRKVFDDDKLESLAKSIKEHGILQDIVVLQTLNGYRIIAGERRWRAARLAGLRKVPCKIYGIDDLTEQEIAELSLLENIQREDLNPIETAQGIHSLMEKYSLTQEVAAERIGLTRTNLANIVRLLMLEDEIQEMIAEGELSPGHGKALLAAVAGESRIELAKKVVSEKISVRELERIVASMKNAKRKSSHKETNGQMDLMYDTYKEKLISKTGSEAQISYNGNKGKIMIKFNDLDEFERIMESLGINLAW